MLQPHRTLMTFQRAATLAVILLAAPLPAEAANARIGVVAPASGEYAVLGQQILNGAELQAGPSNADITVVEETCEEGSGTDIGEALAEADVDVAIGFLCSETLTGALPVLKTAGIPAITLSVRSMPLMNDALANDWPLWRMAPNETEQTTAIVDFIMSEWADDPVALVDDGTIYYRELVNAVRNAIEQRGLKPVFVDTFRPAQEQQLSLVRRLAQAGARRVLIGGTRGDIAIIARDAADQDSALTILGGDALIAAETDVPLRDGVLAIGLPEYGDFPPAADLLARAEQGGIVAEGYFVPAASAVELGAQAVAAGNPASLSGKTFDTFMGPLTFAENHELTENPFMLLRWQNGQFVPVFDSERQAD